MMLITEGYLKYKREIFMDYDEMLKDELWEDMSKQQLIDFYKRAIEIDNTEFNLYFDNKFFTLSRLGFDYVFFLGDYLNLINHSFSTDNLGVKKYQEVQDNSKFLNSENWNVHYEFEFDINDRKSILDYDCFKVIVKQIRFFNGETDCKIYELYVTDKIKIPAHIIAGWWEMVIDFCPLEITDYNLGQKKQTYSKTEIQIIQARDVKKELRIPDDYRHLIKEEDLIKY